MYGMCGMWMLILTLHAVVVIVAIVHHHHVIGSIGKEGEQWTRSTQNGLLGREGGDGLKYLPWNYDYLPVDADILVFLDGVHHAFVVVDVVILIKAGIVIRCSEGEFGWGELIHDDLVVRVRRFVTMITTTTTTTGGSDEDGGMMA